MPFVMLKSTAGVSDGSVSLNQLKPNTAQRNFIYDGEGKTTTLKYLDQSDGVSVVQPGGAGNPVFLADARGKFVVSGLAAYLLDNIDKTAGGNVGTASEANAAVTALQSAIDAGTALGSTEITNILVAAFGGGTGLSGTGNSTATVEEILEICAGRKYVVPKTAIAADEGSKTASRVGGFTKPSRKILSGSDFTLSLATGELNGLQSASLYTVATSYPYRGGAGVNRGHSAITASEKSEISNADMISVYADDGSVLD